MTTLGKSFTPTYHQNTYPAISPSRPELSAHNNVVVITGGGQGIGKATALAFAEAKAHAIIITGRNQGTLLETKLEIEKIHPLTRVRGFVGDITDAKVVDTTFCSVKHEFGRVDVLINNAGYLPASAPITEQDPDDIWRGFEVNTRGTFNVVGGFLRVASSNATLINISSFAAHVPLPNAQAYSSSKAAVLNFLEHVQQQHPYIRVVSIHPGVVLSAMNIKSGIPPQDDGELVPVW
jgi:NAD(P)-dependent dehydrogenase (short-subunit alcohol dehydrogenase family)